MVRECPTCHGDGMVDVMIIHPITGEADRDVDECPMCKGGK